MKKIILSSALCLSTLTGAEIDAERGTRYINNIVRFMFNGGIGVFGGAVYEGISRHPSTPFNATEEVSLQSIITFGEGFVGEGAYYLASVGNKQKHMAHVSSSDLLARGLGRAVVALVACDSKQASDKRIDNGKINPWGVINSDLILGALWTAGAYGLDQYSGSPAKPKQQSKKQELNTVLSYKKDAITPAPQSMQQVPVVQKQVETSVIISKSVHNNVTAEGFDAGRYFEQLRSM